MHPPCGVAAPLDGDVTLFEVVDKAVSLDGNACVEIKFLFFDLLQGRIAGDVDEYPGHGGLHDVDMADSVDRYGLHAIAVGEVGDFHA